MTKYKFTQSQFEEIRLLLKRRVTENRDEQKKTRAKIRKLGFMISDYFSGFSDIDFKKLLDKGDIEIIGKQISNAKKMTNTVAVKSTTNTTTSKYRPAKFSWDTIQHHSDEILSCGLNKLKTRPFCDSSNVSEKSFGNYLISLDKVPFYIGEGKDLVKRLKQQFKPTTSTFYKNFEKRRSINQLVKPSTIDKFEIQFMPTKIGRKEVEECGIVNLPTKLNSFQLGKRKQFLIADQNGLWNAVQENFEELLKEGEITILKSLFKPWFETEITSLAGLYLVKDESEKLIYIGESSDVGERIKTHSGRTYFSALRRHIGTDIFGFELKVIKGKKKYFDELEDQKVSEFLKDCKLTIFPVTFGRYELEEYLIKKHRPLLNRKDNKD